MDPDGNDAHTGPAREAPRLASDVERWNHNLHYHPVILRAIPQACQRALDVGCGEGTLTRQLRQAVPHVTGIDIDAPSIEIAQAHRDVDGIDYLTGDFLTFPFESASFDLITSVASLHHMDAVTALARMQSLLRPGGVLAVVGLARMRYPVDLPWDLAGFVTHRLRRLTKGYWEHPSPKTWSMPLTFPEVRVLAARLSPGARYHRHLLWRYSLIWNKPS